MNSQLKPWDGTTDKSWIKYDTSRDPSPLYCDTNGTIYYIDTNGTLQVWCAASRLAAHLQKLYQLGRASA